MHGPGQHQFVEFVRGMASVLLPRACAVCREPSASSAEFIVCAACLARTTPLTLPLCDRCGHPRLSVHAPQPAGTADTGAPDELPACSWCARLPAYVRAVRSVCRMDEGTGAAIVHALKYSGWSEVAKPMAQQMARLRFPDDVVRERTALVPLPLSPTRERARGYNQAERVATELSKRWGIPVWLDVVFRTRETRSQVELTPSERTANVAEAFTVSSSLRQRLHGTHIVLVDDVVTTAASLNAAALALTTVGARIISYITFGRAPDPGDRSDPHADFFKD